jgi:hypothetical protein
LEINNQKESLEDLHVDTSADDSAYLEEFYKDKATQTEEKLYQEKGTQSEQTLYEEKEIQTETDNALEEMENKILALKAEIEILSMQKDTLESKLFKIDRFRSKPSSISFYTGFPNYEVFLSIFNYLDPGVQGQNIRYWSSASSTFEPSLDSYDQEECDTKSEKGRPRKLKALDEYFLVLCRLRQGFAEEHLCHLFDISISTVSRIVISWVNFMYLKFTQINIWPSREIIDKTMPEAFKENYSATRVIIDCTEVRCQMPSSLQLNGELFSNYKNHTTLKGLIGISPGGANTFVSELYTGSISDREIVIRSGFLDLPFKERDLVMADKGFTIDDLLLPLGVDLRLPPFLGSSNQMAAVDVVLTQEIASLRIHVERAINKIKNFHIWDRVVPIHQLGLVNQMWAVCAFLCNAQPNIIST